MKKFFKISLLIVLSLIILVSLIGMIFISTIMKETKNVEFDKSKIISATRQISYYDNNGENIDFSSVNGNKYVALKDISDDTINCFLCIEDKKFYSHHGLNYKRMAKALLNNLKSKSFKEGASTISQQLIKNTHLSNEKTIKRKLKEIVLTKKLEKSFTKDEILETYLNVIYFGDGCYGIEKASNHYFNKPASELSLQEASVLAGLIKAPAIYSPTANYDNSLSRRNVVLKSLYDDGYISDEEYKSLCQKPIELNLNSETMSNAIYMENVKNEAEEILEMPLQQIALKNYKIYTYFDQQKQKCLEDSLNNKDYYDINSYGTVADSLGIILDSATAGVSAMYGKSKYNLTNFKRQPGSAIKPILVYAPALDCGEIYNCSQILDEQVDYNGYSPNNVGNEFHGYVSIRESVAKSLNIPAVKIMDYVGIEKCKSFAQKSGIKFSEYDNGLAIALGGFNEGITMKELVNSYVPFVNDGKFMQAKFIKKITTSDNKVLYENPCTKTKVMGDDTAYLMTDLLIDGVKTGTSSRLKNLPFDVAGKTGTVAIKGTNLNSDVYSIAYTTSDIVGVWLGNYTFEKENNLEGRNNGGTFCTSIVKDVMQNMYTVPPKDFEMPESVVSLKIDEKNMNENHTILLANEDCPERYTISEIFAKRFAPTEYSDIYTNINVDFDVEYLESENKAVITFSPYDYLSYDVYCNGEIIKTIQNKSDKQIIEYTEFSPNSMYTFYINAKNDYNNVVVVSSEKSIYTKNVYNSLIQNEVITADDLSWYFM